MKIGFRARLKRMAPLQTSFFRIGLVVMGLAAAGFLSGCKNFWAAPAGSTSFSLTNGGNITVTAGATSGNTSLITVTPANSFSGTVTLTCLVTTSVSNPVSMPTCSLSPTSVSISGTTAETSTLTATTASSTATGAYLITVTGASSGVTSETTSVCVEVGTTTGGCSASTSGYFYILNGTSISGYSISSSKLNTLSGTTYTLTGATAMAMGPKGNFLYVASLSGITLYTIDTTTGALGQGSTAVFGDTVAEAIQVDPSGKWLLDASATGTLNAFPITSSGAQDTSRQTQSLSMNIGTGAALQGGIAISPSGTLVAVALDSTGIQVFPFSATSATPLGSGPVYAPHGGSGGAAIAVAIDPQSRFLYVGETGAFNSGTNSGALRVFTIGSSASLTEFTYSSGAPYAPAGLGPHAILPDSTGSYVYAASWQSGAVGTITGYSVTTSALTAISNTPATGTEPYGLAEDSTGSFVLAVSNTGPTFDAYSFARTSGQLGTPLTGTPVSTPIAIVAVPAQ
ncbi:MAG: beta-propeller fold lactonase family protein [Terracidiphilus sp.]